MSQRKPKDQRCSIHDLESPCVGCEMAQEGLDWCWVCGAYVVIADCPPDHRETEDSGVTRSPVALTVREQRD